MRRKVNGIEGVMAEKLKGSGDPDESELWYRVSLGRMLLSFEVLFFKPVLQNEWLGDGVRSFSGAFGRAEFGRKDKWIRAQFNNEKRSTHFSLFRFCYFFYFGYSINF